MHFSLVFLLFAVSLAVKFPSSEQLKQALARSYISPAVSNPFRGTAKMCGTYQSECVDATYMSIIYDFKFSGEPEEIPEEMVQTTMMFLGSECEDEYEMEDLAVFSTIEGNSTALQARAYEAKFKLTVVSMEFITCVPLVTIDQWYSVRDYKCVDSMGEDPFIDLKEMIGVAKPVNITFNEDSVKLEVKEGQMMVLPRLNGHGCNGEPTDPPTEKPTPKPTPKPTEKPTEQPTEQPTNQDNTAFYWILGLCNGALVIILLFRCYRKYITQTEVNQSLI